MDYLDIIELINHAALLLALGLIYDTLGFSPKGISNPYLREILTGFLLGVIGIALMLNSWDVVGGVFFDTRSILLCIAGFFFGIIPITIAVLTDIVYRLLVGGPGAPIGVSIIVTSGAIGVIWRHMRPNRMKEPSAGELYLLGIVVHVVMLACMLLLPLEIALNVLSRLTLPVMLVYPLATLLLGKLMVNFNKRKFAEEALRQSEAYQRAIIEASPLAIYSLTPGGYVKSWNAAAEKIFGWKEEEVSGKILPIVREDQQESFGHLLKRLIDGKSFSQIEMTRQCKDGSPIEISLSMAPVFDKKGNTTAIMAVAEDITKRKVSEEEKELLNAQLNQAQKMESVGRLAGGVAHDYNNMLAVILGYTELAQQHLDSKENIRQSLDEIKKAAEKSVDITRQLLAFSRKQTVSPRVIDLNSAIENTLKMLHRLIGEDISLTWIPNNSIWPIKFDPSQIDQILVNLCVNARDAIENVGQITIETDTKVFDEFYCDRHAGFVPGEFVKLSVSDNGCGMSQEVMEHLFEPFFTTKEMGKGSGLGLATVYGIVKQNQGFINVYSEPHQGTTMRIYFPRHDAPVDSLEKNKAKIHDARGNETILVVEDDYRMLNLMKTMLEDLGYSVLQSNKSSEAISIAKENKNKIQVLITDVVMPEMNGRELAQQIQAFYPSIKVLFVSGYTANVIAHRGILDKDVNFLQKPFSQKEIGFKIREILSS